MARRRKKDEAEIQTDELLDELEKRIVKEYSTALKEIQEKYDEFTAKFKEQDKQKKKDLKSGKITQEQYDKWRLNRLFEDERYRNLATILSEDLAKVDQKVMSIANGYMPQAYALNFNYSTYEIEQGTNINTNFTLYSRETVEKLIKDGSITLPKRKVDIPKDQLWNKQHINSAILQGILQGDSIPDISKRLQQVTDMDRRAAVRNARTMMTGAQNSGRMAAYERADKLGIKIQKEWMATLDHRTRDSHQQMDGERMDWKKPFSNKLMYPGDPEGEPAEVYNCRCTMVPFYPEYANIITKRITYSEWSGKHTEAEEKKPVQHSSIYNLMVEGLKKIPVKYNEIKKHQSPLSEEEIVSRVGGGDLTNGSCASLGLCYIGQKNGLDVLDFRGGESENYFATRYHLDNIFKLPGISPIEETAKSEITAGKHLLKRIEEGKQYYFCVGRHAAIVRKEEGKYQYMELQTALSNGWTNFNGNPGYTLSNRFGCRNGRGFVERATMIDIEDFTGSEDFYDLLGYINTPENEQKKGKRGYAK